jgi:hypothetical protein
MTNQHSHGPNRSAVPGCPFCIEIAEQIRAHWDVGALDTMQVGRTLVLAGWAHVTIGQLYEVLASGRKKYPTRVELIGALLAAIHDMHANYPSTAGWRGGIGGRAITRGCSFIDPPPDREAAEEQIDSVLRAALLTLTPEEGTAVQAYAKRLITEPRGQSGEPA